MLLTVAEEGSACGGRKLSKGKDKWRKIIASRKYDYGNFYPEKNASQSMVVTLLHLDSPLTFLGHIL